MTVSELDHKYDVRPFVEAPVIDTTNDNTVIKLDAIDLSKFKDGPEGSLSRKKLADQLEKTITTSGFFNVVNYGYDLEKLEHLKAVAQSLLKLPEEEKRKYYSGAPTAEEDLENKKKGLGAERGEGYKPKGFWKMKDSVRDSIDHFNFRDAKLEAVFAKKNSKGIYPEVFSAYQKEVNAYYKYVHEVVLRKVLTLCDIILEIPEGTLYGKYFSLTDSVETSSGGHGRFMLYHPLTENEASKVDGTWLRGHSDISAFSIITSQPILSLQISDYESGEWKYVDYRPNSLVCNIGDALEFLTGGYFKASMHRVSLPPTKQLGYERLVLIDFINPLEDTVIHPTTLASSKLKKVGLHERPEWDKITYKQWDAVKGALLGADGVGDRSTLKYYGRQIERWHYLDKE
ncbi:hypothetical protein CAAN3_19S02630 [[Candida] anglica]